MGGVFLMIKKIFAVAVMFFLVTPMAPAAAQAPSPLPEKIEIKVAEPRPTEKLSIVSAATGKTHEFEVEIADTEPLRAHGLMFRSSMPENHGMLFLFDEDGERNFWMKNTYLPLDIIFIAADGKIVNIGENATPLSLQHVSSAGPVRNVLELNGGMAKKLGLAAGDMVKHKAFGSKLAE